MFDPLSRDVGYDPTIMAAQRKLEDAERSNDYTFDEGFSGRQDLSTDIGRQAWATSGLFGLMLSKLYSEEDQQKWFVQRNAVDFGYRELDNQIEAWRAIGETRDFTQEEHDNIREMIARKELIKEDLEFVYANLDGDMDATLDEAGKSFNDRWALDTDENDGFLELLSLLKDNPSYTGGVISAELLKDLPFLGIAKLLGVASKGLSISEIVAKVNAKLAGIKPKALRGLSQMGTGVGAGAAAGGSYEALYSELEQGSVKGEDVWMGAEFGGAFGVLGGAGLMYKGALINRGLAETAEETLALASSTAAGKGSKAKTAGSTLKTAEHIRKASDDSGDDSRISSAAKELTILPAYKQTVEYQSVKGNDVPMYSVYDLDGKIKTYVDKRAIDAEHKRVLKDLEEGTFRGRDVNTLTRRELDSLKNKDSYEAMLLAYEKSRASIDIERRRAGDEFPPRDLNDRAYQLTLDELDRVDGEHQQRVVGNQAKREQQAEVEQAVGQEEEAIRKQNMEAPDKEPEVDDVTPQPPGALEGLGKVIRQNPKTAMAVGGAAAYGYADTPENEFFGTALAVAAVGLGPKVINGKTLKASAMKAKIAMSKSIEGFAINSKILEFQMQNVLKEVVEVFDEKVQKGAGMLLINALEDPHGIKKGQSKSNWDQLSDPQKLVAAKVRAMLDIIGDEAVASGVIKSKGDVTKLEFGKFKKGEQGAFLNNYFPHIFDKDIDEDTLQELVAIYLKESKSKVKRTMMETLEAIAEKYPDKTIIKDPVRALELYTQAMTRTIYGKNLINSLFDLNLDMTGRKLPALMSVEVFHSLRKTDKKNGGLTDQEALHYVTFDHPSLQGYVAHTDVKGLIDDQFATLRRGGMSDVAEGILKLNNGLKRLFVFGSLFHAQALMMSAAYALGPSGIVKGFKGGKVSIKDADGKVIGTREAGWSDLKIGSGEFNELAEEAIKSGLQIIAIKKQELVNPGFKAMEEALERLGPLGALGSKAFKNIDYLTWEYFHDRFKLAAYLQKKQRLIDKDGHTDEVAGRLAAEFANDAFGSLDWNNFATKLYTYAAKNPNNLRGKTADALASILPINKRRWLNLGLFAPDWTVSNIRIVGKMFTSGYKYSEGFLKAFHKGDTAAWKSKQGKELASSFKMYAAYSFRAGVVTSGMWWAMTEAFTEREPTVDDLQEFWFGETSGKLQLGNGESMIISKQIAEPIHWVQHPAHTLMNKGSVVPKTIVEGMFNKQWLSMKKGFPMGPTIIDPDGTVHTPKWILGKAVPIVTKPLFDTKLSWGERFQRTFSGFFGFPQYGNPGNYD